MKIGRYDIVPADCYFKQCISCSASYQGAELGHKGVKIPKGVYAHVTRKSKASTIEKFDNYLSN